MKVGTPYPLLVSRGTLVHLDRNERTTDSTYVNNKDSMLGFTYQTAFWTATKKLSFP